MIALENDRTCALASSLLSGIAPETRQDLLDWLADATHREGMRVERVPLDALLEWRFEPDPLRIVHRSGRFFSVEGIRTRTDFGPKTVWDQPIINQPEVGILGLLAREADGAMEFLMQAKTEPGNINGAQLSPTVQATHSNYQKVHGGRTPQYLEYFIEPGRGTVILDQLQGEQGARFLRKRNRNMVVLTTDPIPETPNFRWTPLRQIKEMLAVDHFVNMDVRSIVGCLPMPSSVAPDDPRLSDFGRALVASAQGGRRSVHTTGEIIDWLSRMASSYSYTLERRGLDEVDDWVLTREELYHHSRQFFSVVGVSVESRGREVASWRQPLLYHPGKGLNGMVTQEIDGVLHFLIRACFYPGNSRMFELGTTVSRSDYAQYFGSPGAPPFLDLFQSPDPAHVRYSSVQSEEGGRFLHYRNEYVILRLPQGSIGAVPDNFAWMTLRQIEELMPHGYFNIEARNLLACLHPLL